MCTVSIKVNDKLLDRAKANMDSDVDIALWLQQQIEAILMEMALAAEKRSKRQAAMQRLMDFAAADPSTITLDDLAGILPAPQTKEQPLPDVVLSLLGAGMPLNDDDLNGREAYYKHLEEKHQ